MIMMMSFSSQKLRAKLVSAVPPCPRSVPRVGMVPSPPCERKYNVTPMVSSVTPSSCWVVYGQLKSTMITVGYEMFVWSLG